MFAKIGRAAVGLVFIALSLWSNAANAKRTEWIYDRTYTQEERPLQLDIVATVWPFGGFTHYGAGVWLGFPLLKEGFVPLNDSLYLEAGGFVASYREQHGGDVGDISFFGLVPAGGVRWNLHLTTDWTIFATAKLAYRLHLGADGTSGLFFDGTVGAYWMLASKLYLRLETGNFGVLQVGLSIPM